MNTINHASHFKVLIICLFRNEILACVRTVSNAASKTASKYSVDNIFNISTSIKVISIRTMQQSNVKCCHNGSIFFI